MKREIDCLSCAKKWQGDYISDDFSGLKINFPIEYKKYVHGKARADFKCDGCNVDIPEGSECVAFSLYTDKSHYHQWESDYLEEIK